MATGKKAFERIAYVTGILLSTVERAGRSMKEDRSDLWPLNEKRGGGRDAVHVCCHHLVSLVLGLAGLMIYYPASVSDVPKIVKSYRAMVLTASDDADGDAEFAEALEAVAGLTFGQALDTLVDRTARRNGPTPPSATFQVIIGRDPLLLHKAEIFFGGSSERLGLYRDAQEHADIGQRAKIPVDATPAHFVPRTTIPFALFDVLADLWRDTLVSQQPQDEENAETLPGASAPTP